MSNQRRFALIGRGFGSDSFAQAVSDIIGGILTDSAEIDFTYDSSTPSISASLINASVTFARLQNFDALSVLGRASNSSGVSDEIAAGANDRLLRRTSDTLNFGQLTAGMFPNTVVPDAALSSNVALLDANNTFTGTIVFSNSNLLQMNGPNTAEMRFNEQDATADNRLWAWRAAGDQFILRLIDDGVTTATNAITIDRTLNVCDEIDLTATLFDFNGTLDIDGGNHDISTTGTLTLSGTGETLATFVDDGAVTLYHNNTARLATDATGVTITGSLTLGANPNITLTSGTLSLLGTGETMATFADDGAVTLYHNNTSRIATSATGVDMVAGLFLTVASASGGAGIRLPHGAAPSSPVDGDMWTTTSGLFVRINGVTVGPLT